MQAKTTRAFRTISEAGDELGLQPHVLRFWESKFPEINPIKRGGGRRFYRPEDIELLRGIKTLLHEEKHPIKDVQKLIKKSGAERVVELGRSVEKAARERSISDTTLVPDRISKPDLKVVETKPAPPSPKSEPEIPASPPETLRPDPTPLPVVEAPLVRDEAELRATLSRLEALRERWRKFDSREAG